VDKQQSGADRFFKLQHYVIKSETWLALTAGARAIYVQIGSRYDGKNNGKLAMSVRTAAKECRLDKDAANRAFKSLVEMGFIEETRHGSLSRKTRIASEWRLTAFKCDLTGAPASNSFLHRSTQASDSRAARARPKAGRLSPTTPSHAPPPLSPLTPSAVPFDAQSTPKLSPLTPSRANPPVPFDGTHIDIYPSPRAGSG
jgi:Helix-turn-helix domain